MSVSLDESQVQLNQAQAMRQLADAGYDLDSVAQAVVANDFSLLKPSQNNQTR